MHLTFGDLVLLEISFISPCRANKNTVNNKTLLCVRYVLQKKKKLKVDMKIVQDFISQ